MSDDFETITAKRGDRAREIEALRARYRSHRETLMGLVADSPTELIAADYRRVIADIDVALARLNEAGGAPPPPPHPARRGTAEEPLRLKTEPGLRPLVAPPSSSIHDDETINYVSEGSDSKSRLVLIAAAALIALAAIAWLIWRASDKPGEPAAVTSQVPVEETATVQEAAPIPTSTRAERPLVITPDSVDYGIVRKGTRTTRQYEIVNNGDEPISPQVARSTCRCLYYEYAPVVPPKAKETLTVTIDGAKAKPGPLLESIRVSAKSNPSVVATFDVTATVR